MLTNALSCKSELGSLQGVRNSVIAWRNESLAGVSLPVSSPAYTHREATKPSAFAALREFFNLSPLWLKGAVAFASILFVVFAGLAIARLRATPAPVVVAESNNSAASEKQLNALVERRVQEELQRIKASQPEKALTRDCRSSKRDCASPKCGAHRHSEQ